MVTFCYNVTHEGEIELAKRYYWLKLKEDFFRNKVIKKLRKVAGGDTYVIIYLKLQLLSLKHEGMLVFDELEETLAKELALEIDEDEVDIDFLLYFLKQSNLLQEFEENEFTLIGAVEAIGSESASAERVRNFRAKKTVIPIQPPKKEIDSIPFEEIIHYLNLKVTGSYKHTTINTIKIITTRWNEGWRLSDFYKVIDNSFTFRMNMGGDFKYMNPSTIFNGQFENRFNGSAYGYVTEKAKKEEDNKDPMEGFYKTAKENMR